MSTNQSNNSQRPRITINPSPPHSPGLFSATPSSSSSSSSSTRLTPFSALLTTDEHNNPPTTPRITLDHIVAHLRTPLHPLVSSVTGIQHPAFPRNLLAFHLLTDAQLDELAVHYHQVWPPVQATFLYPVWVPGWVSSSSSSSSVVVEGYHGGDGMSVVDLETKRRRLGRFMGMRGCESPVGEHGNGKQENGNEMAARMEREWQEALARAANEHLGAWRKKGW